MNASSPTSLLEAMILAHDLIVLVLENTKKKNKSRDLEGARWPPRPALAFSRDRGRGPVGSKEHLPILPFVQNKSCSRKLEVRIP